MPDLDLEPADYRQTHPKRREPPIDWINLVVMVVTIGVAVMLARFYSAILTLLGW